MKTSASPKIAVVGAGYWGPKIVRNVLAADPQAVAWVCDRQTERLNEIKQRHPEVEVTTDYEQILADPDVDAVMLALPPVLHYEMAMRALRAGKHLFVEKPMALTLAQVQEIAETAKQAQRVLMIGLTYRYHRMIDRIAEAIREGRLGKLVKAYSRRTNFNRKEIPGSVVWMLAPHDVSIFRYWFGQSPQQASADLRCVKHGDVEDEALIDLEFDGGAIGHIYFSWLDPVKTRRLVVVGSERALVYDEMADSATCGICRVDLQPSAWPSDFAELDDVLSGLPAPEETIRLDDCPEPLGDECRHFLYCLKSGDEPKTGGREAMAVTAVIEQLLDNVRRSDQPVMSKETAT